MSQYIVRHINVASLDHADAVYLAGIVNGFQATADAIGVKITAAHAIREIIKRMRESDETS